MNTLQVGPDGYLSTMRCLPQHLPHRLQLCHQHIPRPLEDLALSLLQTEGIPSLDTAKRCACYMIENPHQGRATSNTNADPPWSPRGLQPSVKFLRAQLPLRPRDGGTGDDPSVNGSEAVPLVSTSSIGGRFSEFRFR